MMKYKQVDKIVDFLEYVFLCAKRHYILEKEGSEVLAEVKEYDNKIIHTMEKYVKENMDGLTYINLLRAKKTLMENCDSNTYLYIRKNAYDKSMQDITVVSDSGNIFTIHVLHSGRITVANMEIIHGEPGLSTNSEEISEYISVLGNYLKSYLQGNDQGDMYLSILDTIATIDPFLYIYATPLFREIEGYSAFFTSLIIESDKFFPCNAEYRKGLIVLEEKNEDNYYVHIKSIDKICTIEYNSDNSSLSFSLSALDE